MNGIFYVSIPLITHDYRSPPPGEQRYFERWSLVYFTRPHDSVVLRALTEDSPLIAEAVARHPEKDFETGFTAGEWLLRRFKNIRLKNYTVRFVVRL